MSPVLAGEHSADLESLSPLREISHHRCVTSLKYAKAYLEQKKAFAFELTWMRPISCPLPAPLCFIKPGLMDFSEMPFLQDLDTCFPI